MTDFYLFVFVSGFILTVLCVHVSIGVAQKLDFLDAPDGNRKLQDSPIPRLGGAAVAVAFSASIVTGSLIVSPPSLPTVLGIILPALGLAAIGLVDDVYSLNPWLRITGQGVAASIAWILGTRVSVTNIVWLDFLLMVLWVLVVVNGINLLDNSDGLAASTTVIAGAGASIIALIAGQELVSLLGTALVAVALGFLWHNWFPAKVYLGDAGSYFLGFLLAILTIRIRPEQMSAETAVMAAILLLALPVGDTIFVVVQRLRRRVHPFTAGRDHLSHRLQAAGSSVPLSVLKLQAVSVVGSLIAVLLVLRLG